MIRWHLPLFAVLLTEDLGSLDRILRLSGALVGNHLGGSS